MRHFLVHVVVLSVELFVMAWLGSILLLVALGGGLTLLHGAGFHNVGY